jgi:RNA polymerase-associated protein CTR9
MRSQKTKEEYYKDAAMRINASDGALRQCESDGGVLFLLARGIFTFTPSAVSFLDYVGIHQMATRSMEDALRCFDAVMSTHPTNVIALLGKVCYTRDSNVVKKTRSSRLLGQGRVLYARRQYAQALKLFQDALRYNPECKPDPRIGIGLCFWALDQKPRAKAAWERSLEVV